MKKIALAVLGLTAFAGSALAADMAVKPVYKAAPAPAPVYSWTGCYVGAGGGYAMANSRENFVVPGEFTGPDVDFGQRGWFGTVQGGCDYQFQSFLPGILGNSMVIGAFADYDFGSIKGNTAPIFDEPFTGEEKQNWSWAVGARLGWLPFNNLLTYVSGGYTQAHYNRTDYAFPGGPVEFSIDARTFGGWFLGSGYEYNLGWLPGLTWKTEYRFADYGHKSSELIAVGGFPTGEFIDQHKYVQSIRSELVWRFNWGR